MAGLRLPVIHGDSAAAVLNVACFARPQETAVLGKWGPNWDSSTGNREKNLGKLVEKLVKHGERPGILGRTGNHLEVRKETIGKHQQI